MYKFLSSYSDNDLAFLLDSITGFIEQTHKESKRLRSREYKTVKHNAMNAVGIDPG
jgi:hypothetical protein